MTLNLSKLVKAFKFYNWKGSEILFFFFIIFLNVIIYTAVPRQKGITDNFVKIELSPLPGPEWQYFSVGIIKHPILDS